MFQFEKQDFISQLSIDCVIFGYENKALKVLVPKLKIAQNYWALPGGFIKNTENIDEAALRILYERTGLKNIFLEQFRVFGKTDRINNILKENLAGVNFDPSIVDWLSKRFISIGYYALVDIHKVKPQTSSFDMEIGWQDVNNLPNMIMDHKQIVEMAKEMLRQSIDSKLIGFNLLPETFTMREIQELYEAIFDKPFARNNFQKKILDLNVLDRLEKKYTGAANKAPFLYQFKK